VICAIAAIVLATAGCDDTQPDTLSSTTATLSFSARALVELNHCWDTWIDSDVDGVPDFNLGYTCEPEGLGSKSNRAVAWHYSLQVSILRAGETVPEIIASSVAPNDTVDDYISFTPYDPISTPIPDKPPEGQTYYFDGVEVSTGSQIYLQATGHDFGTPNVLGSTPALEFQMAAGDTVIVEARKQSITDAGNYLQNPGDESNLELVLIAALTVGGSPAQVQGNLFSSFDDAAGIAFSYTRR
jgi:hypothetical protein